MGHDVEAFFLQADDVSRAMAEVLVEARKLIGMPVHLPKNRHFARLKDRKTELTHVDWSGGELYGGFRISRADGKGWMDNSPSWMRTWLPLKELLAKIE
jgi:hypothetical protein